ncbi:helix-turn-helix domain-containing protein [Streptomyces sp. NBC_01460]|uniref:helix-turn-helix domain-containing protein n=1 Tax=Streptomyces sp. NBC_01460 TaxID=2903875 RepID=UPI003FCCB524
MLGIRADFTEAVRSTPASAIPPFGARTYWRGSRCRQGISRTSATGRSPRRGPACGHRARRHCRHPTAVTQCADSCELSVAARRPSGVYHLEDGLVEYQLTRPGPALRLSSDRFSPIDRHPGREETLRVCLRNRCDRRLTAAELHLHPDSLDYRLAEACGFDATDPGQHALARTAMCARDVAAHRAGGRA